MDITRVPSIETVEKRLIFLGVSRRGIAAHLSQQEEVAIDETTWRRWRNGQTEPTLAAWTRVVDHVVKLQKKKREKRNGKMVRGRKRNAARPRA